MVIECSPCQPTGYERLCVLLDYGVNIPRPIPSRRSRQSRQKPCALFSEVYEDTTGCALSDPGGRRVHPRERHRIYPTRDL